MANEALQPGALLVQDNLVGAVTAIDDDPDSPDGSWLTASSDNSNSVAVTSFPTPTGDPTTGAGLQNFKIYARLTTNGTSCTYNVYLRENGTRINGGSAIATGSLTSTSGQLITATWNASLLGTADGSLVECEFEVVKSGGSPSNRTTGEVGAVEWNVDYTVAGPSLGIDATSFAATPASLTFRRGLILPISAASVTNSPVGLSLLRGLLLGIDATSFSVSPATLDFSTSSAFLINPASFTVTPASVTFRRGLIVPIDAASVTNTPAPLTLVRALILQINSQSFIVTPASVDLLLNAGSVFPMTNIGRDSRATPDAGVSADIGSDVVIKTRRDQVAVLYAVRLVHDWITQAEFDELVDFVEANGYGPHDFTFRDINYTGTLTNLPAEIDHRGDRFRVESNFLATRV